MILEKPKIAIGILSRGLCDEFQKMLDAIEYPNKEVFLESGEPQRDWGYNNYTYQHARRCASIRNRLMRRILVESDAEYILSLDDDVYCPPNVIEELVSMKQPVSAAWVPNKFNDSWVAGQLKVDEEDVFIACRKPMLEPEQPTPFMSRITPVDCSLWKREVMERIQFRAEFKPLMWNYNRQRNMYSCECFSAGTDLLKLGILCAMSTRVVCKHKREVEYSDHPIHQMKGN